ncbi:MAG: PBP1A family penicillin-binding protein [Clostridia bacterium]|nr:PBP1A family penicillin-binding protein [Clostridia bacterium]
MLNTIMTILLIALITVIIVGVAFGIYITNYVDGVADVAEIQKLTTSQDMTTRIYYMDYSDRTNRIGTPVEIENQQLFSSENRTWVTYDNIPTYLVEAFVSIEDERFWTHSGVDWKRTFGATLNFAIGKSSYGGSTITQQLIKNVTGNDEVTIQRKVSEIMSALELEKNLDKTEILEMYLNTIYLSEHCYGIQAAANAYFDKDVSELNLTECAALAAIPKYPYKYDPYVNPENNLDRRETVLWKMHELDKITDEEYQTALDTPLVISENVRNSATSATTSWYTDAVIEDTIDLLVEHTGVSETLASQMIYTGGLRIYTVMDPFVQKTLEDYFVDPSNFPTINKGVQPEASMVVIDPKTGDILGLVGGRGEKTSSRILNYATQTTRSPGSSIKPVAVYGPALEYGVINYSTLINDAPVKGNWPANYPAGYRGPTPIYDAVARSVNTVSVRTLQKLGLENSYDFVHNKLGMTSVIGEYTTNTGVVLTDINLSALALGGMNYGVTVRELTSAYQIFANKGIYTGNRTVIKILDSNGNVIVDNSGQASIVMSEQNASIMTKILQGVISYGTGSRMNIDAKVNVAGKTGTTSDDCDRWFMGYTPYYIGGVWFGYAMPMSLNGFSETRAPSLAIWDDIMAKLHQPIFDSGEKIEKFTLADGVVKASVCSKSGKLATKSCDEGVQTGYFVQGNLPTKYCDVHKGDDSSSATSKDTSTDTTTTSTDTANTDVTGDTTIGTDTLDTTETTDVIDSTDTDTTDTQTTTDTVIPDSNDPNQE